MSKQAVPSERWKDVCAKNEMGGPLTKKKATLDKHWVSLQLQSGWNWLPGSSEGLLDEICPGNCPRVTVSKKTFILNRHMWHRLTANKFECMWLAYLHFLVWWVAVQTCRAALTYASRVMGWLLALKWEGNLNKYFQEPWTQVAGMKHVTLSTHFGFTLFD